MPNTKLVDSSDYISLLANTSDANSLFNFNTSSSTSQAKQIENELMQLSSSSSPSSSSGAKNNNNTITYATLQPAGVTNQDHNSLKQEKLDLNSNNFLNSAQFQLVNGVDQFIIQAEPSSTTPAKSSDGLISLLPVSSTPNSSAGAKQNQNRASNSPSCSSSSSSASSSSNNSTISPSMNKNSNNMMLMMINENGLNQSESNNNNTNSSTSINSLLRMENLEMEQLTCNTANLIQQSIQQRLAEIPSPTNAQMEEINTKDLAHKISSELKRYSIPQAVFAQRVLCRSQGTLSDLLRNPKPWSKLKSGRETFRRMYKWIQEPEAQRMNALRIAGGLNFY